MRFARSREDVGTPQTGSVFGCLGDVKPLTGFQEIPLKQTHGADGFYGLHGVMIFSVSSVFGP